MQPVSQIVVGADGTVLAATGPWAPGLVDQRLDECNSLPLEIRQSGQALVRQLRARGDRMAFQSIPLDGRDSVQLIAIGAMAVRRTAIDLRALLASKLDVMSAQALAVDVTLGVVVSDEVPAVVSVDSEKVAWAITTLVGSALRYTRSGSHSGQRATTTVRASFDAAGSQLVVEVRDDGPGIPADTVRRLFKRDGLNVRGAGLALLLISDVCAAHGGSVEVLSNTGPSDHGTIVRLVLPTPGVGEPA